MDFDALARINPDVKAWIYIKGTGINYPIVQTTDNTSYLHRTFEGKDSFIGAIFLDAGCEADFSSENSIVYGHNLKNGQMFGMLKKHYDTSYNADADYKDHQKIWIITPQEEIEYQVFAAREIDVNVDADVYTIEFATEEDYADYLKTAVEKSALSSWNKDRQYRKYADIVHLYFFFGSPDDLLYRQCRYKGQQRNRQGVTMGEKNIWERIKDSSNCRVLILNLILTLCLNLLLEFTERRSVSEVFSFVQERTFVFLYNGFIIFLCLSVVFLVKKKIFAYVFITGCWSLVAIANGIVLSDRKTPFTAVDLTLVKSVLPFSAAILRYGRL